MIYTLDILQKLQFAQTITKNAIFKCFIIYLKQKSLLAHDIQTTSHVRTAGCICLHTNGMTHVHPWDEQTWIKILEELDKITFLPPEMYILRMYGICTLCTSISIRVIHFTRIFFDSCDI